MNIQVNANHIKCASEEIYKAMRQTKRLSSELEDVEKALLRYTEFTRQLQALKKVRDDLAWEQYKLSMLAQALVNIRNVYHNTETAVEDNFESQSREFTWMDMEEVDLTEFNSRVNIILYGGDSGWQA